MVVYLNAQHTVTPLVTKCTTSSRCQWHRMSDPCQHKRCFITTLYSPFFVTNHAAGWAGSLLHIEHTDGVCSALHLEVFNSQQVERISFWPGVFCRGCHGTYCPSTFSQWIRTRTHTRTSACILGWDLGLSATHLVSCGNETMWHNQSSCGWNFCVAVICAGGWATLRHVICVEGRAALVTWRKHLPWYGWLGGRDRGGRT